MPVAILLAPVPSRFTRALISVSRVLRSMSATRISGVPLGAQACTIGGPSRPEGLARISQIHREQRRVGRLAGWERTERRRSATLFAPFLACDRMSTVAAPMD